MGTSGEASPLPLGQVHLVLNLLVPPAAQLMALPGFGPLAAELVPVVVARELQDEKARYVAPPLVS